MMFNDEKLTALRIAHGLGHSLGAKHDSKGCRCSAKQCIMMSNVEWVFCMSYTRIAKNLLSHTSRRSSFYLKLKAKYLLKINLKVVYEKDNIKC